MHRRCEQVLDACCAELFQTQVSVEQVLRLCRGTSTFTFTFTSAFVALVSIRRSISQPLHHL